VLLLMRLRKNDGMESFATPSRMRFNDSGNDMSREASALPLLLVGPHIDTRHRVSPRRAGTKQRAP
jgi:hypothetical protein